MGYDPIPLLNKLGPNPATPTKSAEARACVRCHNRDGFIKKGAPAQHRLEVLNRLAKAVTFEVHSTVETGKLEYADSHTNAWPVSISMNPSRSGFGRARWVPKAAPLEHPGDCAPGNSHTVEISISVVPTVPGENVDIVSDGTYAYTVACEC